MKKVFILLLYLFCVSCVFAQTTGAISVQALFGNSNLQLDKFYKLKSGDSVKIETLSFYISGIELLNSGVSVWKEKNSFHLIDVSKKNAINIPSNIKYDHIKFNLGIDSVTNVSGAMGGDLDPTKGMYWTWQSGYINFKLEGNSNLCATKKSEFQFHLGGYQYPANSLQTIQLSTKENQNINIVLDLEKVFSQINLSKQNHIMMPGKEAVSISKNIAHLFSIQ